MAEEKSKPEINAESTLTIAFKNELQQTALDLMVDYGEVALDSITDVLSEFPLIKTIVSFYKVGMSFKKRDFIRKLFQFFQEYKSGQISSEEVKKFNEKMETDKSYREKVTEHILLYVDKVETTEKAKILARLLLAHTQGHYDWSHFTYLSASLNRLHPFGLAILNKYFSEQYPNQTLRLDPEQFEVLASAGLAYSQSQNVYTRARPREDESTRFMRDVFGIGGPKSTQNQNTLSGTTNVYYLSTLGKDLCLFGIKTPTSSS